MLLIPEKHLQAQVGLVTGAHSLAGIHLFPSSQAHSPLKLKLKETPLGFSCCALLPE